MKPIILVLLVLALLPQTTKPNSELVRLRNEFVKANEEYKQHLGKLLKIYEGNVVKAEERLSQSRQLRSEGLIPRSQVEENERAVTAAKRMVDETKELIANADKQIAEIFDDTKLQQEYKQAVQQRRKARKPRCTSWTLTANQRSTANSVSFSYRFICQN